MLNLETTFIVPSGQTESRESKMAAAKPDVHTYIPLYARQQENVDG